MPRDFVPCVYHERVEPHRLTPDAPALCLDVIELFDICDLTTQQPDVVIGPNSRQYTMRDTYSVSPHADLTETRTHRDEGPGATGDISPLAMPIWRPWSSLSFRRVISTRMSACG